MGRIEPESGIMKMPKFSDGARARTPAPNITNSSSAPRAASRSLRRAWTRLLARDRAPVVRVRCEQACPAFHAFMRFGQFFSRRAALPDDDIARVNAIIGDAVLVQRGEESAFANHEHSTCRVRFTQKIR